MPLELNRFSDAGGRFHQRQRYVAPDIPAFSRTPSTASEKIAEDASEGREDILHVAEVAGSSLPVDAGMSELIVPVPLFRIAQDFEGIGRLLEPGDGLLVSRVLVGMVFDGQFTIRGGDRVLRCSAFHLEYFVIIAW